MAKKCIKALLGIKGRYDEHVMSWRKYLPPSVQTRAPHTVQSSTSTWTRSSASNRQQTALRCDWEDVQVLPWRRWNPPTRPLHLRQISCTDVNQYYVPMVTKYAPPCCRAGYIRYVKRKKRSISTAVSRRSNRSVLFDSEHKLQILQQQLRTTLTSLTTCCPATWRPQPWP